MSAVVNFALGLGVGYLISAWVYIAFCAIFRVGEKVDTTIPQCQCNHVYSNHMKGYKCQAGINVKRNSYTERLACPCTIYVGPDPLISGLWSPPTEM